MKFGPVPIDQAAGAVLAHSLGLKGGKLKKGTVLDAGHIDRLLAAGIADVTVARLEEGDVGEDDAAAIIASALAGATISADDAFTGRANLFAGESGVFTADKLAVDAINRADPGITLATLPDHFAVEAGRMVATVKIIPYAVPRASVDRVLNAIGNSEPVLALHPYRPMRVGVISTELPGLAPKVIDKTLRVLGERLKPAGASIVADERVGHDAASVAGALHRLKDKCELLILFGASAVADREDVLPAGIERAGGTIDHFGMPVDPGNLLLVGTLGNLPVIGAPGCARSPRENGFDWVLQRLLAGLPVTPEDITGMGVGGLLMEIVSRPQPRAGPDITETPNTTNVAAVILAAGKSSRMGGPNKLLATLDDKPLVRHVADAASGSKATSLTLVTGHRADEVARVFEKDDFPTVHNPDYANGLSSSLAAGIGAVPEDADAAIVLLGDMPRISAAIIDRLIDAFNPEDGVHIVVPTFNGKRGNPVLWSRRFFDELRSISGDVGARHLIGRYGEAVTEVEIGPEVALDLDTPEALAAVETRNVAWTEWRGGRVIWI